MKYIFKLYKKVKIFNKNVKYIVYFLLLKYLFTNPAICKNNNM